MDFQQWWGSGPTSVTVGVTILDMAIRLAALGIVPHNRRPTAALAWLTVIFFIPLIGIVLFLLFGSTTLDKRRRALQRHIAAPHVPAAHRAETVTASTSGGDPPSRPRLGTIPGAYPAPGTGRDTGESPPPVWVDATIQMNESNGALPLTSGNRGDLLPDYEASIDAMAEAVGQAVSFVHVEFYIAVSDDTTEPLFRALEEAHRRGVQVRVLLDHVGSAGFPGYKAVIGRLDTAGIAWRLMLPVASPRFHYQRPDLRNHRKILVVDDRVGFTGSQNMIDASYNKKANKRRGMQWRDLTVRLEGPAVPHLNAVFFADWVSETGEDTPEDPPPFRGPGPGCLSCQILPSGPGNANESNLRLFLTMIYNARQQVTICSPYFVPDESLLLAVTSAVQRGVKVRLLMGSTSDHFLTHHAQRSYYEMLLAGGVAIHLYPEPFVLHSKFVVIDGRVSVVASSNMDMRSFALNQEVNLLTLEAEFAQRLDSLADQYIDESHRLDQDSWAERPLHKKFLDNMCRLTANLQ